MTGIYSGRPSAFLRKSHFHPVQGRRVADESDSRRMGNASVSEERVKKAFGFRRPVFDVRRQVLRGNSGVRESPRAAEVASEVMALQTEVH